MLIEDLYKIFLFKKSLKIIHFLNKFLFFCSQQRTVLTIAAFNSLSADYGDKSNFLQNLKINNLRQLSKES